jgi:hypothetical protein
MYTRSHGNGENLLLLSFGGRELLLRFERHGHPAKRTRRVDPEPRGDARLVEPVPAPRQRAPGLPVRELRQAHRALRRRHLRAAHVHEHREQRQRDAAATPGLGSWPARRCRRCRLSRLSCRGGGGLVASPKEAAGEVEEQEDDAGRRQARHAGVGGPPARRCRRAAAGRC